jgi:hypothetical protein
MSINGWIFFANLFGPFFFFWDNDPLYPLTKLVPLLAA